MISNESQSTYGRQPYGTPKYNEDPRPQFTDEILDRGEIQIDRKTFILTLKENSRGRFLRVVERSGEYHQSVVIPASGLDDFYNAVVEMVKADGEFPPAKT